jgi:serine-type D-Ala-D-Ala carboxypeptidase
VRADALISTLARLLEEGAAARVFSGAQGACWIADGRGLAIACAGATRATGGAPIEAETPFDVASLTKLFTASAALRLAARGAIGLDEALGDRLPELAGTAQARATLAQVLAHEAGFTPWAPLYEAVPLELRGTPRGRAALLEALARAPAASAPDGVARYSDLGFIALGVLLERTAGMALDALIELEVARPIGLARTRFGAAHGAAATASCPWRGRTLAGEVHDDNAWTMGGISGHAGLFSTASDVARFAAAWLDALRGEGGFLPPGLAEDAVRRRPSGRGLGFDLKSEAESSAGALMSRDSFGHLGFTGCSLWVDPERGCAVALLTNRVHTDPDLAAIKAFRPRFHDSVLRAFDRL